MHFLQNAILPGNFHVIMVNASMSPGSVMVLLTVTITVMNSIVKVKCIYIVIVVMYCLQLLLSLAPVTMANRFHNNNSECRQVCLYLATMV